MNSAGELVKRIFAAWDANDTATLTTIYSPEIVWRVAEQVISGRDAVLAQHRQSWHQHPDHRDRIVHIAVDEATVFVEHQVESVDHQSPLPPRMVSIMRVDNDHVSEMRTYW